MNQLVGQLTFSNSLVPARRSIAITSIGATSVPNLIFLNCEGHNFPLTENFTEAGSPVVNSSGVCRDHATSNDEDALDHECMLQSSDTIPRGRIALKLHVCSDQAAQKNGDVCRWNICRDQ